MGLAVSRLKIQTAYLGAFTVAALDAAPDTEAAWLVHALCAWILRDELPTEIPPNCASAWAVIRHESEAIHAAKKQDADNGKCGGRPPKKPKETQTEPKETQTAKTEPNQNQEREVEEEKEVDISPAGAGDARKRARTPRAVFNPPTITEIVEFCREEKIVLDATEFVNYYAAQGWRLANGNPMKNWKAAIHNWKRMERERRKNHTPTTPIFKNETGLTAYRPADGIDCAALGI